MSEGFKLPDLSDLDPPKSTKPNKNKSDLLPPLSDGISDANDNVDKMPTDTSTSVKPKDSDKNILTSDLNVSDTDFPSTDNDDEDNDGLIDLNDSDFDNDGDEQNNVADSTSEKSAKLKNINGIVQDVQKGEKEILLAVTKKSGKDMFYLRHEITGGNIDSMLDQARKGTKIEIQYNDNDSEITDNNIPVYTIVELLNIDNDSVVTTPKKEDEPNKPQRKSSIPKKRKNRLPLGKRLVQLNNKIGDSIYRILGYPFIYLCKIPIVGPLLNKTNIFWKYVCRLWLLFILLLAFLLLRNTNNDNEFTVTNEGINVEIINPVYNPKTNLINAKVKNNSNTYAYYYLSSTVTKKSIIPFLSKHNTCTTQSVGQGIGNTMNIQFKCNVPSLSEVNKYQFDIHNNK